MNKWRLIINSPKNGAWNMAVDEAVLESTASKTQPPTLRLYDWSPYALSLGHAQPFSDVNMTALQTHHWTLVRRPTGGRAILHADELTYSVCSPLDNPAVSGSVLESYQKISAALLRALEIVQVFADSKPKDPKFKALTHDPVCFQYSSDYEITINGKKLIGSAQARKRNGLLQHGAIPLFGDITRIINVLNFSEESLKTAARENLKKRALTIEEILGYRITWFDLADAMRQGFKEKLEIDFIPGTLSKEEINRALDIYKEKHTIDTWTLRI